jgi:hypothetical protein
MDKRRLQQLRSMATERFKAAGIPIDDVALDLGLKMAQDVRFQKILDRPEQIVVSCLMAGFFYETTRRGELSDEQWDGLLQALKPMIYGLRPKVRERMNAMVKALPRTPSTGRNEILDPEKKKEACELVSKHHLSGMKKSAAYERVAREMNCSVRTIQRAWQERDKLQGKATRS